jgi:hypothetical protein
MSKIDLNALVWLIDKNLKEIGRRLEPKDNNGESQTQIITNQSQVQLQVPHVPQPPTVASSNEDMTTMMAKLGWL